MLRNKSETERNNRRKEDVSIHRTSISLSSDTDQSLLTQHSIIEFFLNGAELSLNSVISGNLINHSSMNWAQFKDPVSHMCLAGTVVVVPNTGGSRFEPFQ